MGGATCFVYVFAALAPFIAMNIYGMKSAEYGIANILPTIGLIVGSIVSAQLVKKFELKSIIGAGIWVAGFGILYMLFTMLMHFSVIFSVFVPMIWIYFGLCFVMANASAVAMSQVLDKAHGSAVMNFINMGGCDPCCVIFKFISSEKPIITYSLFNYLLNDVSHI